MLTENIYLSLNHKNLQKFTISIYTTNYNAIMSPIINV